jgi:ubiquinone/menaquinone biosynthesis C-methylase UbiE
MSPIDRPDELKSYYQKHSVVDAYMRRRTAQPLNGLLHRRQVEFLNAMVASRTPRGVLEIACGPGRLTTAIHGVPFGVAVDASQPMLETARRRLNGDADGWSFLRSDAFVLPFCSRSFELVYTLRFVRHFQLADRQRLYDEVRRVLRPGGAFVVDALNRDVSYPSRLKQGLEKYEIYDVLYSRAELVDELEGAGFRVVAVEGMLKHFRWQQRLNRLRFRLGGVARVLINSLEQVPGNSPSTWMVLCETPT